ncbi:MAG: DNA replication/repair protein RecF [Chloroflexi bacterium]|nr:DNA replication/repair protein RecF [Chloroflexota bacterium]
MHVAHLSLTNFRNYVRLELDLPACFVVFHGDNAQGKTNLLEAVFYLGTTRSPRASADRELVNWLAQEDDMPFAKVTGKVHRARSSLEVDITLLPRADEDGSGNGTPLAMSKRIRLNGLPKRATDLVGQVNVVMFSPQDIELISGPPHLRRRYLDIMNSQVDSHYLRSLQVYARVLVQRNHLLRQIRDHQARPDQLEFWNQQLVDSGAYIMARRQQTVEELSDLAQGLHPRLTGRQEHLKVSYLSSLMVNGSREENDVALVVGGSSVDSPRILPDAPATSLDLTGIKDAFRARLGQVVEKEVLLGMSVVGPHRDDLQLRADGVDLNVYGSRGQQRTAALSLKLSEAKLMLAETGEQPILLLDDMMSELDGERRGHLLEGLRQNEQVLITTTDLDRYRSDFFADAAIFKVERGQIERAGA